MGRQRRTLLPSHPLVFIALLSSTLFLIVSSAPTLLSENESSSNEQLTLSCPPSTPVTAAVTCTVTFPNIAESNVTVDTDGLQVAVGSGQEDDSVVVSLLFNSSRIAFITVHYNDQQANTTIVVTDTPDCLDVNCPVDYATLTASNVPCAITATRNSSAVFIDWSAVQLLCEGADSTAITCPVPPSSHTFDTALSVAVTSTLAQSINVTALSRSASGYATVVFKAPATSAWVSCPQFANVSVAFGCVVSAVSDGDLTPLPSLDLFVAAPTASCNTSATRLNATSAVYQFICSESTVANLSFFAPNITAAVWTFDYSLPIVGIPLSLAIDCPDTGNLVDSITCVVSTSPPTYVLGSDMFFSATNASIIPSLSFAAPSFLASVASTTTQSVSITAAIGAVSTHTTVDFFAPAETLVLDCEHVVAINETARCVLSAYANNTRTFLEPAVLEVRHDLPDDTGANYTAAFSNSSARGFELELFLSAPFSVNVSFFASAPNATGRSYVVVIDNDFDSTVVTCVDSRVDLTDTEPCTISTFHNGAPVFQLASALRPRATTYGGGALADESSVQLSSLEPSVGKVFHFQVSSNVSQLVRLFSSEKDSAGLPLSFTTMPSNLSSFLCAESTFEITGFYATVQCQLLPKDSSGAPVYIDIAAKSVLTPSVESFFAPHLGPSLPSEKWHASYVEPAGTEGAVTAANTSVEFYAASSGVLVMNCGVHGVPGQIIESIPRDYHPDLGIAVELSIALEGDPKTASKTLVAETIANLEVDASRVIITSQALVCKLHAFCVFKFIITPSQDIHACTSLDLARKLRMRMVLGDYVPNTNFLRYVALKKTEFLMTPHAMRPCGSGFITAESDYCAEDDTGFLGNVPAWALFLICTAAFAGFLGVLVFFWKRRMRMSAQWVPMEVRPSTGTCGPDSGSGTFVITNEVDPTE